MKTALQNPKSETRRPKEIRRSKFEGPQARPAQVSAFGFRACFGFRNSVLGFLAAVAFSSHAQTFSIDWSRIAGGGGTSTNGQFSLSGTIGQADAALTMSGGNYSLSGGFWSLFSVVQTPGAPTLTIVRATPGNATISWSPSTPGYVLQETLSLSPANWTNSPSGSTNPTTVPATLPGKYFRLFKP